MCTGSHSSWGLSAAAIWSYVGRVLCSLPFLEVVLSVSVSLLPSLCPHFFFPLLSQCNGCLDVPLWGLMAGLQELLAMGAFYCLGTGWSQWRPLDILGTHLPLSLIQLLIVYACTVTNECIFFKELKTDVNAKAVHFHQQKTINKAVECWGTTLTAKPSK